MHPAANRLAPETSAGLPRLPASLPPPRTDRLSRAHLIAYFENSWTLYDVLFSSLRDDASLYQAPDPLRHPLVFYLGHTAAFYVNKLVLAGLIPPSRRIDPGLERLFEQGVDPSSAAELGGEVWPAVETVRAFRRSVHELVLEVLGTVDLTGSIDERHPVWALLMGVEHERIHFETSSVLIRQVPVQALGRPSGWTYAPTDVPSPRVRWLQVPSTRVQIGKERSFPTFGWDNEYGHREAEVAAFEATQTLVTNADFRAFLEDGGYQRESLWCPRGWAWRTEHQVRHPRFWIPRPGGVDYRAMFDVFDLPDAWPAEVTCFEARAYCNWVGQGARLPTEAEFHALARSARDPELALVARPDCNLNLRYGSPAPVGPREPDHDGFFDLWGNVWQWLRDDFQPLAGFQAHPYYLDFSAPYMDPDHALLLGGSWASTGTSASRFYRLWFRRFFHQHAGFRMARDL